MSPSRHCVVAIGIASYCLWAPPLAMSQGRAATVVDQKNQREAARASVQQVQPEGALVYAQPQFTLTAEKGRQKVSGTIGIAVDNWSLDTTFSGPIGEEDDEASSLTLGGLQNGASIRLGFSHGTVTTRRMSDDVVASIDEFCEAIKLGDDCDTTDMSPSIRAEFIRLFLPRTSVFWGVHLTLNREKFTYSPDKGLTDTSLSHTNQAFTGSIGILTSGLWFFGAHIEQQRFRKASGPAIQVCVPLESQGSTRCRNTRLGAPADEITTRLLKLEGRRVFVGRNVGINPRFTADLDDDVQSFELPIYFMREQFDAGKNPVPSLNGGVSMGWHSKEGAVIRAFVGVAFKLVNVR